MFAEEVFKLKQFFSFFCKSEDAFHHSLAIFGFIIIPVLGYFYFTGLTSYQVCNVKTATHYIHSPYGGTGVRGLTRCMVTFPKVESQAVSSDVNKTKFLRP